MPIDGYPRLVLTGGDADELLKPLALASGDRNEAWLRDFILRHPLALPTAEIDPAFADPIGICSELRTAAGPIDALLVNRHGAIVLVECKLFRNPQARREVVAQILDYAKEIARWRYSDLQAAVSQRLGRRGENALYRLVADRHPEVTEASFVDAVSRNLARGRFMLLIAGDGIRQETEAIAEYIQDHAALRFTLGLVELRGFGLPEGRMLVQPRLLARTVMLERTVFVTAEAGAATLEPLAEYESVEEAPPASDGRTRMLAEDRAFWAEYVRRLVLDDPAQPIPTPRGIGNARASLGHPDIWLMAYRARGWHQVGVVVRLRGTEGRRIYDLMKADAAGIEAELAPRLGGATLTWSDWNEAKGTASITAVLDDNFEPPAEAVERHLAFLLPMTNAFANAFRPRIRAALAG